MNVVDRKNRTRKKSALLHVEHQDLNIRNVALGCVQHHDDDYLFHQGITFQRMCVELAVDARSYCQIESPHQSAFLGHIVIELLLDSILCERDTQLLDRYYDCLASLNPDTVQSAASLVCQRPVSNLTTLIAKFLEVRFLKDYETDEGLLRRLNGVMQRVGLPPLPERTVEWLPSARQKVRQACDHLLAHA